MNLSIRAMHAVLFTALLASQLLYAQDSNAPAGGSPGIVSKILRSFGLQGTPGKQGNKAYKRGDFAEALRKYAQAGAENRAAGRPASPALSFNTGNSLYKQKRFAEAASSYEQALKGVKLNGKDDSSFAARAHYNMGNALYQKGASADSSATEQAIGDVREALAHYKKSLQIDPKNREAKQNLEQAQSLLQQLLKRQQQNPKKDDPKTPEPSQRAQEALARALQLAQERRYPEAMKVLEDILRTDPSAASYRSHLQRLDDVNKILNGQVPASPAPGDPRARQKGLGI
jgi:Ca-activated chloride channel family protein